jgi:hypothetical protein
MTQEQTEAFDAVERINDELFKKYNKLDEKDAFKDWIAKMPILSVTVAGNYLFIGLSIPSSAVCVLPEITIYSSENNDRVFYEKSNKYETFYKFIKRKFIEIKEEIYSVKL